MPKVIVVFPSWASWGELIMCLFMALLLSDSVAPMNADGDPVFPNLICGAVPAEAMDVVKISISSMQKIYPEGTTNMLVSPTVLKSTIGDIRIE